MLALVPAGVMLLHSQTEPSLAVISKCPHPDEYGTMLEEKSLQGGTDRAPCQLQASPETCLCPPHLRVPERSSVPGFGRPAVHRIHVHRYLHAHIAQSHHKTLFDLNPLYSSQ